MACAGVGAWTVGGGLQFLLQSTSAEAVPALHACALPASHAPAVNTQAQPFLCLRSTLSGGADSRSHTLARHRDILHDFQQASHRLRLLGCILKLSRLLRHSRLSAALSLGWLLWLVAVAPIGPFPPRLAS